MIWWHDTTLEPNGRVYGADEIVRKVNVVSGMTTKSELHMKTMAQSYTILSLKIDTGVSGQTDQLPP